MNHDLKRQFVVLFIANIRRSVIPAFKRSGSTGNCNFTMHLYLQSYFKTAAAINVVLYLLSFLVKQKTMFFTMGLKL